MNVSLWWNKDQLERSQKMSYATATSQLFVKWRDQDRSGQFTGKAEATRMSTAKWGIHLLLPLGRQVFAPPTRRAGLVAHSGSLGRQMPSLPASLLILIFTPVLLFPTAPYGMGCPLGHLGQLSWLCPHCLLAGQHKELGSPGLCKHCSAATAAPLWHQHCAHPKSSTCLCISHWEEN